MDIRAKEKGIPEVDIIIIGPRARAWEKGFNYMNDNWYNAWGTEGINNYYPDDWCGDYGGQHLGYFCNLSMLLEKAKTRMKTMTKIIDVDVDKPTHRRTIEICKIIDKCAVLEHDLVRKTTKSKPIVLQNKFRILQSEDDNDNDEQDVDIDGDMSTTTIILHQATRQPTTTRSTKRPQSTNNNQREPETYKSKMTQIAKNGCGDNSNNNNTTTQHGRIAHQAANDKASGSSTSSIPLWRRGWHPGFEHSGCLKEHGQHVSECNGTRQQTRIATRQPQQHNGFKCSIIVGGSHWDGPHSSRGSKVDCSSTHWHSSQSQCGASCANWSSSFVLFVVIYPSLSPHEWAPRGEDSREVMSFIQASPVAKLIVAPRFLCQIVDGTSFFNSHEVVRSGLALYPSTCTCPSPIEGRGGHRGVGGPTVKRT